MIMRGVGRLWATPRGYSMRRQDALHRRIGDTNFWRDTFEGDGLEVRHGLRPRSASRML